MQPYSDLPTDLIASTKAARCVGRPRNLDVTDVVRKVALSLAYKGGIANATIERIAQRSGVAKTTIYRRWSCAGAVVMDAFLVEISPFIPYVEKRTVEATFKAAVRQLVAALQGPRGRLLRHLLGAAQIDVELQRAFLEHWIEPRRAQAKRVIARSKQRGELRRSVDEDLLVDAIFGAVYYRLMMPYAPLNNEFVNRLVSQVFHDLHSQPTARAT
jgi:AcrR family transcriptional regulator